MPITDGSLITAADLNALSTAALALLRADNAQLPGAVQQAWTTFGIVEGTAANLRTFTFVAPVDMLIENIVLQGCNHTAASTTSVDITGDGAVAALPIRVTGGTNTFRTTLRSPVYDNTLTNVTKDFSTTARVVRVFPKGTTVTVVITTTSVAVASSIGVNIVGRAFMSRGLS